MIEFKMPDIGEGVMEGEVVKWLVGEGDKVVDDQPMVEVMTDKATVVIPCPTHGVVQKIRVGEGKTARVGEALVSIDDGAAASAPAPRAEPARKAEAPPPPRPEPARPAAAPAPRPEVRATAPPRPVARDPHENGRRPSQMPAPQAGGRTLAAPATRRLAREAGVDLSQVPGTGPGGRIRREDLVAYLEAGPSEAPAPQEVAPPEQWPGETERPAPVPAAARPTAPAPPRAEFPAGPRPEQRIPLRGLRKRIAERMRQSKDHAAHFTYVEECDMTELVKLREAVEPLAKERGVRLTYLPFIVKAVVAGLKEFPYLNATLDEASQEIVLKGYYNLGIAASNDEGLVVPVVKDCDRRTILEIAAEINRLGDAARNNQLKLDDLQGSTFTITSLGAIGGMFATPVIYYPEVAILGVHKIRRRPVVVGEQIVVRDIGWLSVSLDHRVVDGHIGAQFMQRVVAYLQDPRLLMLGA